MRLVLYIWLLRQVIFWFSFSFSTRLPLQVCHGSLRRPVFGSGIIIRGFLPDFQFGQRSVLNARLNLQPTRLALALAGSASEGLHD